MADFRAFTMIRKRKNPIWLHRSVTLLISLLLFYAANAQRRKPPVLSDDRTNSSPTVINPNQPVRAQQGTDTIGGFVRRDDLADSITISFRLLDSLRTTSLDSTINDYQAYFPVPANYVYLGNNGSPAYPILFTPIARPGWDAGFHIFDVYRVTFENTRFYRTTRPFTQMNYQLASGKEQMINIVHTQNINRNWNFGFEYRLVSAPGFFKTQNTNHNNYRFFSNYQGKKKRYSAYFILLGNKLSASENGGVRDIADLKDPNNKKRFSVNVNLGGDASFGYNVFSTKVNTGNVYRDFGFFFRQSYDVGKKDSIKINDSTNEYLFYPKLRFQHTFNYSGNRYLFTDTQNLTSNAQIDSAFFKNRYDTTLNPTNGISFNVQDRWQIVTNDFVLQQFPETKNPAQFILAGLRLENFRGTFSSGSKNFYNIIAHGEYRNKTRNKKWDASAEGSLYLNGFNSGDFHVAASLARFLNRKFGDVRLSFRNVNRTPSYIFEEPSSFSFQDHGLLKKENITILSASAENPYFQAWFRNISMTNYTYFYNYYQAEQYSSLINVVQIQVARTFRLTRRLRLYSDVILQQTDGASPVRVPAFYTRQRLALEGIYFKNLTYSLGLDIRYNTPYKAYDYSPVMGQFVPQDTLQISNRPTVSGYFNFRIKTFTTFIRLDNVNAIDLKDGLSFTKNNLAAPNYPYPGLVFRLGIQWRFVN